MRDTELLPIRKSVSTELFKRVFFIYLFVAIVTTMIHMSVEFENTKEDIHHELETILKSIHDGLSTSLWNLHDEQINSIAQGTYELPIVNGINIVDDKGVIVSKFGGVASDENNGAYYVHRDMIYNNYGREVFVGAVSIYSHKNAVFDRVKFGFLLIVINSIIKSIVLWCLFIYFSKKLLREPLADLTRLFSSIDFTTFHTSIDTLKGKNTDKKNELTLLRNTFTNMMRELTFSHKQLESHTADLEEKVAVRTQELENAYQSNKRLISDVSHELSTPLYAMKLHLDAIIHRAGKDQESPIAIQYNISHISRIIDDLALLAEMDTIQFSLKSKLCNIQEFVKASVASHEDLAYQKHISIKLDMQCDASLLINIDSDRMAQVLSNLLNNSIKYTDEGGVIEISLTEQLDFISINIADSSPGVSEDQINQLCDRLYRVDSSRNRNIVGSGIGLTISQSIIEAHSGLMLIKHSKLGGLYIKIKLKKID